MRDGSAASLTTPLCELVPAKCSASSCRQPQRPFGIARTPARQRRPAKPRLDFSVVFGNTWIREVRQMGESLGKRNDAEWFSAGFRKWRQMEFSRNPPLITWGKGDAPNGRNAKRGRIGIRVMSACRRRYRPDASSARDGSSTSGQSSAAFRHSTSQLGALSWGAK